jgi:hypothetical protein
VKFDFSGSFSKVGAAPLYLIAAVVATGGAHLRAGQGPSEALFNELCRAPLSVVLYDCPAEGEVRLEQFSAVQYSLERFRAPRPWSEPL